MKALWTEFVLGFQKGVRPFCSVMPGLLRSMAISGITLSIGTSAIIWSQSMAEPSPMMIRLGEGLLIGGVGFGAFATIRAWLALYRASGFLGKQRKTAPKANQRKR